MKIFETFIRQILTEIDAGCRICKGPVENPGDELCAEHQDEPSKLQLLPATMSPTQQYNGKTTKTNFQAVDGSPNQKGWKFS